MQQLPLPSKHFPQPHLGEFKRDKDGDFRPENADMMWKDFGLGEHSPGNKLGKPEDLVYAGRYNGVDEFEEGSKGMPWVFERRPDESKRDKLIDEKNDQANRPMKMFPEGNGAFGWYYVNRVIFRGSDGKTDTGLWLLCWMQLFECEGRFMEIWEVSAEQSYGGFNRHVLERLR